MKDLKTSDFDEFRDLFETKYLFLTGQELKPNQDLFDLNEIFGFEIEAAIKGERDPIEILKECWGYSSFIANWLSEIDSTPVEDENEFRRSFKDDVILQLKNFEIKFKPCRVVELTSTHYRIFYNGQKWFDLYPVSQKFYFFFMPENQKHHFSTLKKWGQFPPHSSAKFFGNLFLSFFS